MSILKNNLLPFLEAAYPDGHQYMQDNDPKHTSRYAPWWYENNEINWWKIPASSPDLDPIEHIWHTLNEFLRNEYKPLDLFELKQGIKAFWESLTPEICSRYIGHLKKVIPKVVEVDVGPFDY